MRLPALIAILPLTACVGGTIDATGGGGGDDGSSGLDGGVGTGPDDPIGPQDPTYPSDHPRIYLAANRDRLAAALAAGDPKALHWKQLVDDEVGGRDYFDFEAWNAALAGQLTGDPSYCQFAVARVDAWVAGQEATIAGGGRPDVATDSYLYVGPRIGDVMLTYDWCYDATSSSQRTRWLALAAQAVWNVWNPSDATWGGRAYPWSGWATHDPSDNYYYSFLRATMLFGLAAHGDHPDAQGWLDFFRVTKFQDEVVPTFQADLTGGGSLEGTGYGVSMQMLFWLYDLWQSTTGEDLARQTTHTRASMLYMLHAILPSRDRIAPIGDQARDSTASLFDYHRNYLQQLVNLFPDDPASARARWTIDHSSVPSMTQQFMAVFDFLDETPTVTGVAPEGMGRAYLAPGAGELFARSSWADDATWLNVTAGAYTQSHAHHDQGHFMLWKGEWLAFDANVVSHSGINQGEEDHNLVRIVQGGSTVRQHTETVSSVTALHRGDGWLHVATDTLPAYDGSPAVSKDERELVFLEPDTVVVFDRVTTASDAQQIWQLNAPTQPAISGARATFPGAAHTLTVERVLPADAAATVVRRADSGEYLGGYRLDETSAGGARVHLHVLSIDGAVTSVTPDDASGRVGVTLRFADGHQATVRFGADGVDGTLTIGGGATVSLTPGVDVLPQ